MATKQVSLRLGDTTIDQLNYLGFLMQQSQARIVADWIADIAHTIRTMAENQNPALREDPEFLCNGGTIISVEEQQAVAALRKTLQTLRIHGAQ